MAIQIRRVTGATPDPAKISGVTFMLQVNQHSFDRSKVIAVEKIGNNFEVIYMHDTNDEGRNFVCGMLFMDENVNVTIGGELASKYIGKFDLAGTPKHVFLIA